MRSFGDSDCRSVYVSTGTSSREPSRLRHLPLVAQGAEAAFVTGLRAKPAQEKNNGRLLALEDARHEPSPAHANLPQTLWLDDLSYGIACICGAEATAATYLAARDSLATAHRSAPGTASGEAHRERPVTIV